MTQIKYLLDEHVDPVVKRGLLNRQPTITVWCIGDPGAPPKGTKDPDILMWCDQKQFLLITNNRASMPVHLSDHLAEGEHCPGIFILSPKMSLGASWMS